MVVFTLKEKEDKTIIEDERYKVYLDRRNQEAQKWTVKLERLDKRMLVRCAFFAPLLTGLALVCCFRSSCISKVALAITVLIYLGIVVYWLIRREFFLSKIEELFDEH